MEKSFIYLYFLVFLLSWGICSYIKGKDKWFFYTDLGEIFVFCLLWPFFSAAVIIMYVFAFIAIPLKGVLTLPYKLGQKRKDKKV